MKKRLQPSTAISPVPVALVSCGEGEKFNITTIAWTGIINSEPPLVYVSIRPSRYSYDIIKNTKEFVINLPNEKLVFETDYCGTKSGSDVDKFKELGLTKGKSEVVSCPFIEECPINLECKVIEIKHLGSHDMFIAEVVKVNVDSELVLEKDKINYAKLNTLAYVGQEYYVADKKVGDRGICLKK